MNFKEYEKLNADDVEVFGDKGEEFLKEYNAIVDSLNDDIEKLDALHKEFGIHSSLDEVWLMKDEVQEKKYRERYQVLFNKHSESYEKYLDMQEELMVANARKTLSEHNIIDDTDEHDL